MREFNLLRVIGHSTSNIIDQGTKSYLDRKIVPVPRPSIVGSMASSNVDAGVVTA